MGNWRYRPSRRYYNQQTTYGYPSAPRYNLDEDERDCGVPEWEKKFCYVIGRIPWRKVLASKYMRHGDIMKWNDSAAEEAFKNAKQRFWAKIKNCPCDIPLPDRDMYIDEINWDPVIDLELMEDLEKEKLAVSEDEGKDEWHQNKKTKNSTSVSPVDANPWENSQPKLCHIGLWLEKLKNWGNVDDLNVNDTPCNIEDLKDQYNEAIWGGWEPKQEKPMKGDNGWGDSLNNSWEPKPEELEKIDNGWDDSGRTKQDEALKSNKGWGNPSWGTKQEMDKGWGNPSWGTKQEMDKGWGNPSWGTKQETDKGWGNPSWGTKQETDKGWGNPSWGTKQETDKGWGNPSWGTKQETDKGWGNPSWETKHEMDKGWGNNSWGTKQELSRGWGNSGNQNNAPQSVDAGDKGWEDSWNQNSVPQYVGVGDNRWGGKKWGNYGPVQRYGDNSGSWNGGYQKMYASGNSSSKFQRDDNQTSGNWRNHRGNKGHGFAPRRR